MGEESRQVELCLVGVSVVWVLGFALLVTASLTGCPNAGRWGIWCTAVAMTWTIGIMHKRSRRSFARSIARELSFHRRDEPGPQEVSSLQAIR